LVCCTPSSTLSSIFSSYITGGTIIGAFWVPHLFLSLAFQSVSSTDFHHNFQGSFHFVSNKISLDFLCLSFPSLFLLNVLENHGNQITNHLFHASTAAVQALPGTVCEISKKAVLILEAAS
jgi:hypothetical protein